MRSSCAQGACKLRSRRLQRQSICLREGSMLPNLVFWPCSGLSASPSASQAASCLSREATKLTKLAKRGTATEVQAAMPVRPFPTPRSPRARRFRRHRSLSSPPLHRGALETAPAAGTAAPVVAMETDASHATAPRPAPPPPPAGKPPPQLPTSRFCAPMRTARTHARTTSSRLRCGAGCRDCLCCTNRAHHVGRAAAYGAGLAVVCQPLRPPGPHPMRTCTL